MHAGTQQSSSGAHAELARWACSGVPAQRSKLQVHRLSSDFRAATRIVSEPLPAPSALPPGHILVRRAYAGAALRLQLQHTCSSAGSPITAAECIRTTS